jgi:hypothetical protein
MEDNRWEYCSLFCRHEKYIDNEEVHGWSAVIWIYFMHGDEVIEQNFSEGVEKDKDGDDAWVTWHVRPSQLAIGKLGEMGWELVSMQFVNETPTYATAYFLDDFNAVFKRPFKIGGSEEDYKINEQ